MTGNIANFIRARIHEERARKQNVGFTPFRTAVLDGYEAILAEHSDAGPGVDYAPDARREFRHTCKTCGVPGEYAVAWPCRTVREIAWVWHSHPDHETVPWHPDLPL